MKISNVDTKKKNKLVSAFWFFSAMKAHASLQKYIIIHVRAFVAFLCTWRQTLAPLYQHGGLNDALTHVR